MLENALQQMYVVSLKDGKKSLYTYRIDRMKNVEILDALLVIFNLEQSLSSLPARQSSLCRVLLCFASLFYNYRLY